MPEFIVLITYRNGFTEYRAANDTRHAKRIIGGLKGHYPGRPIGVLRISGTTDVTADFVKQEA